jgi:hypothetical protein
MTKKKQQRGKSLSNHQMIKQKTNDDPIIKDQDKQLQSILAKKPLEKHLSVQFSPVDHIQFIANRLGKK